MNTTAMQELLDLWAIRVNQAFDVPVHLDCDGPDYVMAEYDYDRHTIKLSWREGRPLMKLKYLFHEVGHMVYFKGKTVMDVVEYIADPSFEETVADVVAITMMRKLGLTTSWLEQHHAEYLLMFKTDEYDIALQVAAERIRIIEETLSASNRKAA